MTRRPAPPIPRSARMPLGLSAVAGVLAGLAVLAQANFLADALATAFTGHPLPTTPLVAVVVAVGVRALATWASGAQGQRAATAVGATMRTDLLSHVDRLGPGWLAGRSIGSLTTLATRGLDAIEPYVRDYLPQMVIATVLPVAVLVQLAVADPVSAVIVAITLPLVPLFAALAGARAKAAAGRQWAALSRLGGHFLDAVAGLPTLVLFGRAAAHATAVRDLASAHHTATMRTLRSAFLSALALELVASLSVALVAVPVALRLLDGHLDLRTALLVLMVVPEAYLPLRLAGQRFHAATEALAVSAEVAEMLNTPAPTSRTGRTTLSPHQAPALRLDNVTAGYPGRPDAVLRGGSCTVGAGEWLAVAGPSGIGKSTVLALILGLLHPDQGNIVIGEHDLSTMDQEHLWRRVAWLPQRPHLFAGTVSDNVSLGCPSAGPADIRTALELACANDFVDRLPEGSRTVLGERARSLSTGQRQRLALARTFLRVRKLDPPIVLLDEPTTGLDLATESTVLAAMRREFTDRTVLTVAHRPAVLHTANRVLALRAGHFEPVSLPNPQMTSA
jgi:ATP-binding cassette subfamily C protein CydD